MSRLLALEWVAAGHEVKVLAPASPKLQPEPKHPFEVFRRPSVREQMALHRWSDAVFHNNICARQLWPLLLWRRPLTTAVCTYVTGAGRIADAIKRLTLHRATTIAISETIHADLGFSDAVIANGYRDDVFFDRGGAREQTLIFVGRLVSDKGLDLALAALGQRRQSGLHVPDLTVVGDGPERASLEAMAVELGIADRVDFVGAQPAEAVADLLNRHTVLLVPSRWREPFGVVALEGLACGCLPVVADGGGLLEAVGDFGQRFSRNDLESLGAAIQRAIELSGRSRGEAEVDALREHLARHSARAMAAQYLAVLAGTVGESDHRELRRAST